MKKGFTLVELLGVIVILGVISLITFPIIDKSIKNGKEKSLEQVIHNIEKAAYEYSIKNELLYSTVYNKIELSTLISSGFLKENIINPVTNEPMKGCVLYKWVEDYNQFEFKYDEECIIKTIEDVVLEKFPYLKTDGNGCVMSTNDNYSYMGGCYLKGGVDGYEEAAFYYEMINSFDGFYGTNEEEVRNKLFDNKGIFKLTEFERIFTNYKISQGATEEQLEKLLQQSGFSTYFEMLFRKKPEEIFVRLNNYVWYSGFLWRIMEINADGTLKMITNENVTTLPYGKKGSSTNWDESYMKQWLNEYFYDRLKGNDLIVNQLWCSDVITDYTNARTTCTNNLSREYSKVGLITFDEYVLAGGKNSYLNIGQIYSTLTPITETIINYIYYDGQPFAGMYTDIAIGVRPVVNIKSDSVVTGGDGDIKLNWDNNTGPYILNENKNIETFGKLSEKSTPGEYVLFSNKKYRIIDKDKNGNTKLILDGFYEESGKIFGMTYGNSNIFTTNSGIGQKLNNDVLNWLLQDNKNKDESKLFKDYKWYQKELDSGYDYKFSLEENGMNYVQATVGLIRIGEILSAQSDSIMTKNYIMTSTFNNGHTYWTMNKYINDIDSIYIFYNGLTDYQLNYGSIDLSDKIYLRPAIVIKSDVDIISGSGTWSNPYEI